MIESARYRHTTRTLAPDYIRAGAGILLTAGPLLFPQTTGTVAWIFGAGLLLFAGYAIHTAVRHASTVRCDENGISVTGPLLRAVDWDDLTDVRVRYFSTRRDGCNGWMQLVVKGPRASIRIESTLSGFKDIVADAVKMADRNEIQLSSTTLGNIEVLSPDNRIFMSDNGSPCRIS
jgi:hypothetical protein